jgi:hypothetical protein
MNETLAQRAAQLIAPGDHRPEIVNAIELIAEAAREANAPDKTSPRREEVRKKLIEVKRAAETIVSRLYHPDLEPFAVRLIGGAGPYRRKPHLIARLVIAHPGSATAG